MTNREKRYWRGEWKRVSDRLPPSDTQVYLLLARDGFPPLVVVGHYWECDDDDCTSPEDVHWEYMYADHHPGEIKVTYWAPIEYPPVPEGLR